MYEELRVVLSDVVGMRLYDGLESGVGMGYTLELKHCACGREVVILVMGQGVLDGIFVRGIYRRIAREGRVIVILAIYYIFLSSLASLSPILL